MRTSGEAEHCVERDLPGQVADRRPEEHRAEDDERHGREDRPRLLDEVRDLAAAVPAHTAEHAAADERGDEAGSPDRLGEAEREQRARERHDLEPRVVDEPACLSPWTTTAAATAPARTPPRTPYPIFSKTSCDGMAVPDRTLLRQGDGERDEEERHADPVVEARLDVQALADPHRQPLRRDDGLAERRVGGGEDDRDEERLGPRESSGAATSATSEAGEDRQRQSDPEEARGDAERLFAAP